MENEITIGNENCEVNNNDGEREEEGRSTTPMCFSVSDFSGYSDVVCNEYDRTEQEDNENQHNCGRIQYRWKRPNPSKWKANVAKDDRSKSLPYLTKSGLKRAKEPKAVDCSKCRFKCRSHFTDDDRKNICNVYWKMNDFKRQKDFLLKSISVSSIKRRTVSCSTKSRNQSRAYFLYNGENRLWRVCSKFFEKTLCISNGPVNMAFANMSSSGCFDGDDKRGKKIPGNKTDSHSLNLVKLHIESFPKIPGHYVRQSTSKNYLDSKLSILKMFELYQVYCSSIDETPVKANIYRNIFCTQYNLSFYVPKKDQCTTCTQFDLADSERKKELKIEYDLHINRKDDCNLAKALDKEKVMIKKNFQIVTFDLQSVLQIPSSASTQMYYSRKINVFNLTLYESGHDTNGFCYTWNELNGKRGSSEIGSILFSYISSLSATITELSLFSDTCGGQNRNQHIAAILLHAVQVTHVHTIEQKFLESGHSYMECDSMHSAIEHSKKNRSVFMMNDWIEIFTAARSTRGKNNKRGPYKVKELQYSDFFNLQELSAKLIKNRNIDEDGNKVSWLKVKCFKYKKNEPHVIFYRYNHTDPYKKININGRGRPCNTATLTKAYNNVRPISEAKKKDLLKLCKSGVIPRELHQWYMNIHVAKKVTDNEEVETECD